MLLLELIMQVAGLWLAILILAFYFILFFPLGVYFLSRWYFFSSNDLWGALSREATSCALHNWCLSSKWWASSHDQLLSKPLKLLWCKKRILDPCELFWVIHLYAVYSDGTLCMDVLQDNWSPCQNVSTILTSIQVLGLTLPPCLFDSPFLSLDHFDNTNWSLAFTEELLPRCTTTRVDNEQVLQRMYVCPVKFIFWFTFFLDVVVFSGGGSHF